jgi:hypothetical protein
LLNFKTVLVFEVSDEGKKWVDSVYNAMTFDEKSGAVIYGCLTRIKMMPIMMLFITEIGGLIFFQGGPYVRLI